MMGDEFDEKAELLVKQNTECLASKYFGGNEKRRETLVAMIANELRAERAKQEKMREAGKGIKHYVGRRPECAHFKAIVKDCSCGLNEALAKWHEATKA